MTIKKLPDNKVQDLMVLAGVPYATQSEEQKAPEISTDQTLAEITQAPPQTAPAPQQKARDGRKNNRPPKKPKRYTVPVTLRISEEQKSGIDRQAAREQTDAADILRRAINEYLQNHR